MSRLPLLVLLSLALAACSPAAGGAPGTAAVPDVAQAAPDAAETPPDIVELAADLADTAPDVPGKLSDVAPLVDAVPPKPDAIVAKDAPPPAPDVPVSTGIRDWTQYPAVAQAEAPTDLWVLGDVHGDVDRLAALLAAAGVAQIPADATQAKWQAGPATLVALGDLIDKGTQGLAVLAAVQALQAQAPAQGGAVRVLMGNHEAEFLAHPDETKVSEFATELTQAGLDPVAVAAGKTPLGQWLRNLPMGLRLGTWFFCHAGDTQGLTLAQLETTIEQGVEAQGFAAPVLIDPASLLEARLDPPWWEASGADPQKTLADRAAALGVQHLVQGHQPGKVAFADGTTRKAGHLFQKYGSIFLVDAGMSQAVDDSPGALLHIHHDATGDQAYVVKPDGTSKLLWSGP